MGKIEAKFTKEFYEDKPELKLGEGSEKTVFQDPDDSKKVIGIYLSLIHISEPTRPY